MTRPAESIITRPPAEMYGRHSGYGFAGLSVNTDIGNFTQTAVDLPFTCEPVSTTVRPEPRPVCPGLQTR